MTMSVKRVPYLALALMASYAAFQMTPDVHPYAFTSCAFGIMYGVFGFVGGEELEESVVKDVVASLLGFVPLSMMNIEFFLSANKSYAMVHALFIIPLLLDLIAKLFGNDGDDEPTQTLKHITNLADVVSLLYLSYTEDNYMFGLAALSYVGGNFGLIKSGSCHGYLVDLTYVMGYILFYFTSTLAMSGDTAE